MTIRGEQLVAEFYPGRAVGEPLKTVTGSEAKVIQRASDFAAEMGLAVEVVVAGAFYGWRVTPAGRVTKFKL